jgi:hypothetical protein
VGRYIVIEVLFVGALEGSVAAFVGAVQGRANIVHGGHLLLALAVLSVDVSLALCADGSLLLLLGSGASLGGEALGKATQGELAAGGGGRVGRHF